LALAIQPLSSSSPLNFGTKLTPQLAVKNVFIRGSVVRYVRMPARAVDTTLLEDATRREAKNAK